MRWFRVVWLIGVMILGLTGVAASETISTTAFPLYVDGQAEGVATPFSVHVTISDWTAVAGSDAKVRVTTTGGAHLSLWNGSAWGTASSYDSAPTVSIDVGGNWAGWIYVKSRSSTGPIKAFVRDVAAEKTLSEATDHSITYMGMSSLGATIYDVNNGAPDGYAILAFNAAGDVIGSYAAEINGVVEGYPDESSYFKMA
ncbi:MAG: hypothetical protein KAQ78_05415, partial [Candidatus Latescibacteria bacterium]|nr:hypothetical protein [Candidatus Latescibacterota bacterium]